MLRCDERVGGVVRFFSAREKTMLVTECPFCKKEHVMVVSTLNWVQRLQGALVQEAFPEMSAEDRERVVSGTCPKCWDKFFKEVSR